MTNEDGTPFIPPEISYLSPVDAAQRLGITTSRLYDLVELGELPLIRHGMTEAIPVDAIPLMAGAGRAGADADT